MYSIERPFVWQMVDFSHLKTIIELSEYANEERIKVDCTQLDYWLEENNRPAKDKKRILTEWIEFFNSPQPQLKEVIFISRLPQELFDAVCQQSSLEILHIKWAVVKDITAIRQLKNLKSLYIKNASALELDSIASLSQLKALALANFKKVEDYSSLGNLTNLEYLAVNLDVNRTKFGKMKNLDFLPKLIHLKELDLTDYRVEDNNYAPILELVNLERLSLDSNKDTRALYDELIKLPKLKYGNLFSMKEYFAR